MEETVRNISYDNVIAEYIDKLAKGIYVGTARGLLYFVNSGFKYPIIASRTPPLVDIFLDGSTLELISFWPHDGHKMYCMGKFSISRISIMKETSQYLLLSIEPHGEMEKVDGKLLLLLYVNKGLKESLKLILNSEELRSEEGESFVYSTLFSF